MIDQTIQKIEARLRHASSMSEENRRELLTLLATLKDEVTQLSETNGDAAESITGFTDLSSHEATRQASDRQLLDLSIEGLSKSVSGFETSHPQLVQLVNRIATILSNLGV